ncbi:site-specific DNA-methyltransferase [Micrococcus sp. IITD107]|uniref:site-specific DNA-methyltransferase n=1 Tax=Micrococcus sp. IITD107 TaxID=3342790 RepID=UPI0035BB799D
MSEEIHETPSTTPNFRTELASQLAELVPEVIADGKVDVEKLKELLDGDAADTSERFGLFWPGKKRALRAAQEPTTATLRPDFDNSKDWDTTKNVFIEGDNLEVLKILQKHYHAKIKMIYIDPPYNTGKDFVYPDNYKEGLDTYLEWTRQVNEEGKKLSSNADTEGRYHSNWLNMMYPRLKLARNLLTQDGVVFISIDDTEYANLRRMCDEVFGEDCFVASIVWRKKASPDARSTIGAVHDHILCYVRSGAYVKDAIGKASLSSSRVAAFTNPDDDPRGPWASVDMTGMTGRATKDQYFEVTLPSGRRISPPSGRSWGLVERTFEELRADNRIWFGQSGDNVPRVKRFLSEATGQTPASYWSSDEAGTNQNATDEVSELFDGQRVFDTPKPTALLRKMLEIGTKRDSEHLVLDFFAGSGTTADAVLRANAEDGGNRRYIVVQLPEPTNDKSVARAAGYRNIADLSRERIRLAAEAVASSGQDATEYDCGFRVMKLADTNFSKWKVSSDVDRHQLEQHLFDLRESSSADDASADDLLVEILLKQGYSLTEQIAPVDVAGLELRSVGNGIVLAYLNEHVKPTLEQLRAVVDEDPARLIVLEDAFQGDDQLKTNLAQLCKSKGIELWTA